MSAKTVFISYSHDSSSHSQRVLGLSERLRDDGLETRLDQYLNGTPTEGWPRWMLNQLDEADFVVVICTETYYRRFRGHEVAGKGKGVDWEGALITQEIYDARSETIKFVPVLFSPDEEPYIPEPLRRLTHYILNSEENYSELYDFLLGQAGVEPRPVGAPKIKERRTAVALRFDQSTAIREGRPRISPTRLSVTGKKFVGREEELQLLDNAWDSTGEQKINIVSLIGQGGEGKTAIALEWYSRRARSGWQGARRVFDWSFYSQGTSAQSSASADDFFNVALQWFGHTGEVPRDPRDKGAKLAELVAAERTLLVLDGLEPLQQPPGDYGGEFKDPAMKALLRGLAMNNPGLCLLTSRVDIADLASFERAEGSCIRRPLYALGLFTARLLLRELGVLGPEKELDEAISWFHRHAYDLNLLGNYLGQCTADHNIRGWQERFPILREDERIHPVPDAAGKRSGHGRRMLRAYVRWLGPDSAAVAILRLLGLFDRPARSDLLDELRAQPVIPGLTDALAELPDDDWLRTLGQLEQLALISRELLSLPIEPIVDEPAAISPDEISDEMIAVLLKRDDLPAEMRQLPRDELKRILAQALSREGNKSAPAKRPLRAVSFGVDAHPLLREHFAAELREEHLDTWRAAHQRLYEYLRDTTPDRREPTLEDLQPLYQAVAHGCQAGLQQDSWDKVFYGRIVRGNEKYSKRKLGAYGSDLGAVAWFFETPWSRFSSKLTRIVPALLLDEAGFALRALGRLNEALEPSRAAMQLEASKEHWGNAAIGANNLSELELTLGEVAEAVRDAEQSVAYAHRSGDAWELLDDIANYADALHQAGRRAQAATRFREAEHMQAKNQPSYPLLYSMGGFRYCDLILGASELAAWQTGHNSRFRIPDSELAKTCDAVTVRAAQALQIVLNGSRSLLDIALNHLTLGRAALYRAILTNSKLETANSELLQAVDGVRRAGTAHWIPAALLTRAWLQSLIGLRIGPTGAQADLDEAWEIAERGPMRLHMADIHLYRARLFHGVTPYPWDKNPDGTQRGPKDDLDAAEKLINECGYHRRDEELADAREASKNW